MNDIKLNVGGNLAPLSVEPESGLLAVTIMGVWQANMPGLDLDDILDFKESLTLVLVAGVFILLAARLDLDALVGLGAGAAGVLLFLQLVAGPVRAFVSGAGSDFSWRERLFLGWLFPRGIVAAAVSSLFALRLESIGYPNADDLVPMVFTIIIGTVILQSFTGRLLANWLGVSTPEPTGVLVVGANPVALTFASALQTAGHRVTVSSLNWKGISKARMAKLNAFYGSAVSSYADRHLDLTGIGHLVALSDRPDLNELACVRYRYEFGRGAVYTIKQHSEAGHEKFQITGETSGRVLFGGEHSIDDLMKLIAGDVEIHTTEITDAFGFDDYQQRYPERLVLFASSEDGRLRFPLGDENFDVRPGWRVSSIGPPGKENGHAAEPHGRGDEGALPVNG